MERNPKDFDYEALKQKFLEQFRSGKNLFGKDGAFGPLLQDFLNTALEAEMDGFILWLLFLLKTVPSLFFFLHPDGN